MSYTDLTPLELVGRRVPDYSMETDSSGNKYQEELPGTFEVGFMLDGAFRAIYTMKAAGLLADVARAQQTTADTSSSSEG